MKSISVTTFLTLVAMAVVFITPAQVHAQFVFPPTSAAGNALQIQGLNVSNASPTDTQVLCWVAGTSLISWCNAASAATLPLNSITLPMSNSSLSMSSFTMNWVWGNATGSGTSLFNISDGASNIGTGYLLSILAGANSAAKPARFLVNGNGVQVGNNGVLTSVGTGGISATQLNGTALSALGTGLLKNTNGTGNVTIAGSSDVTSLANYQTIFANSSSLTTRPALNIVAGTNVTISCSDNSGLNRTDCTFNSSGGGGGGGAASSATQLNDLTATRISNTEIDFTTGPTVIGCGTKNYTISGTPKLIASGSWSAAGGVGYVYLDCTNGNLSFAANSNFSNMGSAFASSVGFTVSATSVNSCPSDNAKCIVILNAGNNPGANAWDTSLISADGRAWLYSSYTLAGSSMTKVVGADGSVTWNTTGTFAADPNPTNATFHTVVQVGPTPYCGTPPCTTTDNSTLDNLAPAALLVTNTGHWDTNTLSSGQDIARFYACQAAWGATATATVSSGAVTGFTSLVGGANYAVVPTIAFGGPGTGATAHAVVTNGAVSSLVVDTAGTGYTTPPTVTINASDTCSAPWNGSVLSSIVAWRIDPIGNLHGSRALDIGANGNAIAPSPAPTCAYTGGGTGFVCPNPGQYVAAFQSDEPASNPVLVLWATPFNSVTPAQVLLNTYDSATKEHFRLWSDGTFAWPGSTQLNATTQTINSLAGGLFIFQPDPTYIVAAGGLSNTGGQLQGNEIQIWGGTNNAQVAIQGMASSCTSIDTSHPCQAPATSSNSLWKMEGNAATGIFDIKVNNNVIIQHPFTVGRAVQFTTGMEAAGTTVSSITGCGTVSVFAGGATGGTFTANSATCAPVITMGGSVAATHGWTCRMDDITNHIFIHQSSSTTTTATFNSTSITSGDTISWQCTGY